jgi:hypothetical protein
VGRPFVKGPHYPPGYAPKQLAPKHPGHHHHRHDETQPLPPLKGVRAAASDGGAPTGGGRGVPVPAEPAAPITRAGAAPLAGGLGLAPLRLTTQEQAQHARFAERRNFEHQCVCDKMAERERQIGW